MSRTAVRVCIVAANFVIACGASQAAPVQAPAHTHDAGAAPVESQDAQVETREPPDAAPALPHVTPEQAPPEIVSDACTDAAIKLEKALRPAYRACYEDARRRNPALEGTIHIAVNVDALGHVSSVRPLDMELGKKAIACIVRATQTHAFDASACISKTLTLVHKYPR